MNKQTLETLQKRAGFDGRTIKAESTADIPFYQVHELINEGCLTWDQERMVLFITNKGLSMMAGLTLQFVMRVLVIDGQPIAANDPGWCGLEGQGYLAVHDDFIFVMDVTEQEINVQVMLDATLVQAWRLPVNEQEVM